MSFTADLQINGEHTFKVLSCSHTISRETDSWNRPSSRSRFGQIDLEIESNESIFLWSNAAAGRPETIYGRIIFKARDEEVRMKVLHFEHATVASHTESFAAYGTTPMTIRVSLRAQTLKLEGGGEEFELNHLPSESESR